MATVKKAKPTRSRPDYLAQFRSLGDLEKAYALLGLCLLPLSMRLKPGAADAAVAQVLARDEVHALRVDVRPTLMPWARFLPVQALANQVQAAAKKETLRFTLPHEPAKQSLEVWNRVFRVLPKDRVAVHFDCTPSRRVRFRWPLRIGFLPGSAAENWMRELKAADGWNGNVYDTLMLSRRSTECDLLVCTEGFSGAQAEIERARRELGDVRADVVAVFAPPGERNAGTLKGLESIRGAAHADGIALFETSNVSPADGIRELCIELSHNHPLDVALSRATSGSALLLASRPLLDASLLLTKTTNLATALDSGAQANVAVDTDRMGNWGYGVANEPKAAAEESSGQGIGYATESPRPAPRRSTGKPGPRPPPKMSPPPPPPDDSIGRPGPRPPPKMDAPPPPQPAPRPIQHAKPPEHTRADMGRFLRRHAARFPWHAESSDASALGSVMRALAEDDEQVSGVRFLQAAFASKNKPDAPLTSALKASAAYVVNVFVGPPREGFAHGDVAFPDLPPPDDGRAHELDVVFWEPKLCKTPIVQQIDLPPLGSSETCRFALRTLATTKAINARITILHRNRVLQTGVLKAPVGRKGEVSFELDAIPRRVLSGLDQRTHFSMAMVLNDTEGEGAVHVTSKGKSQTFKTGDKAIGDLVTAIGAAISDITNDPSRYAGLRAAGTEDLLRRLAVKGSLLREHLERYWVKGGKLETPDHVQLVSTKPGKVFPLEFIYDDAKPKLGAKLCAHAEAALAAGECLPACARHADPATMGKTVCPFGFWGLRCVIERKLNDNKGSTCKHQDPASHEPVRGARSVLKPLTSVLVGATPKADALVATSVADMLVRIRKIDAKAPRVTEWEKWPDEIARAKPSTLALVVHQDVDTLGTPEIEIGPPPLLSSDDLDCEYVHAPGSKVPPIVLLIGCETGKANITYENFALRFQWRGAAIVVSTIAEVVGRQAAPMAADILEAIQMVKEPKSFAVVMRDVRRNLLAQGTPMVLGLVADGDADWDIVGS